MTRASPALTSGPPDLSGVRSMWISEHGPHGPVSPIIQKLSFLPKRCTCDGSMSVTSVHRLAASSSGSNRTADAVPLASMVSPPKTVACRRDLSRPQTLVSSSHAHWIASRL